MERYREAKAKDGTFAPFRIENGGWRVGHDSRPRNLENMDFLCIFQRLWKYRRVEISGYVSTGGLEVFACIGFVQMLLDELEGGGGLIVAIANKFPASK